LPDNFTPNVADLGVRSASVLRQELSASVKAIRTVPGQPSATPQVADFAGRLNRSINAALLEVGTALIAQVDKITIQLLNLTQLSGVVLASVATQIADGQTGSGTFVLTNLGTNPLSVGLSASELKTLTGTPASIARTNVSFSPNPVAIAPGGSTTVTFRVAVPGGQLAGDYYGSIVDTATGQVRGMLSISTG
jgi:hypothetical protein